MKAKIFTASIAALLILIIALTTILIAPAPFDPSFATEIKLTFNYLGKEIDTTVTDEADKKIIINNLKGISYKDQPACGFSPDISITFSDGKKSVTVCPACDSCSKAKIANTGKFITIRDKQALQAVLEKYGFNFPCV